MQNEMKNVKKCRNIMAEQNITRGRLFGNDGEIPKSPNDGFFPSLNKLVSRIRGLYWISSRGKTRSKLPKRIMLSSKSKLFELVSC